jgi:predicted nucleic acid-binding protein
MRVYADSSFLVSCYLLDANTPAARAFLIEHTDPFPFTTLHDLEVKNAVQLGVFRHVLTVEQARAAVGAIEEDLASGRLVRAPIKWPGTFRVASRLSAQHAAASGARSLDILHLAAAKSLRCKELASFDARQRALSTLSQQASGDVLEFQVRQFSEHLLSRQA